MRNSRRAVSAALGVIGLILVFVLYANRATRSSDHQDSPLTVARPGTDISDVFVYPSPTNPANVVFAMNVHPLIPSGQGSTVSFDPGVMYQFKVGKGDDFTEDTVIQFKASGVGANQQITMYGPATPNLVGTRSTFVASTGTVPYNKVTSLTNGITAFAGPREDPFYFDLSQFLKIIPDRDFKNQPNPPPPSASCFRKDAQDFLLGYNVLDLTVEMPRALLAYSNGQLPKINVWATTSLAENDADAPPNAPIAALNDVKQKASTRAGSDSSTSVSYVQIERLARPAIKEATENFKDHDTTNRSTITDDKVLQDNIRNFAKTVAGRSDQVADALVNVLTPDAIQANLAASGPARYMAVETGGKSGLPIAVIRLVPNPAIYGIKKALGNPYRKFGGRDLKSPVMDIDAGAVFGSLIPKLGLAPDDHKETPCLTSDNVTPAGKHITGNFPYMGEPQ